jgi:hypothetical protein
MNFSHFPTLNNGQKGLKTMNATAEDVYDPKRLDQYSYKVNFPWIQRKLWFCAGADIELLKRCPRSEQIKEEGIGGIVLATTVLAFLSGFYAMYIVFGPKLSLTGQEMPIDIWAVIKALVVASIWALIILNLDRFVVSSTGHGDGTDAITLKEIWLAIPRIIMAIIIGLCLAAPLEIRIMESEILAELKSRQAAFMREKNALYDENEFKKFVEPAERLKIEIEANIKQLNENLKIKEENVRIQSQRTQDEASGRLTGRSGEGPGFRIASAELEQSRSELIQLREFTKSENDRLQNELLTARQRIEQIREEQQLAYKRHEQEAAAMDGIITRVLIAKDVGGLAYWVLAAMLMIIEIAPIFFKMMMPRGPYLALQDNQNAIVLASNAIQRIAVIDSEKNHGVFEEKYIQAETIEAFEKGQLEAERELAIIARTHFIEVVAEDIRKNPQKYMDNSSQRD